MEMAEVARCHMARATVAACYNELCGAAAQTVERPRVYAIIPRIVEAFAAASEDAWLQRDVSWVIERFRAAGWEPGPKPSPPSSPLSERGCSDYQL